MQKYLKKKILSVKQLCFNCTGHKHKAAECRSQSACRRSKRRHHTSICDSGTTEQMLVATGGGTVTYPVVVVDVNGIKCRALLDTGAGSSYASSAILNRFRKPPICKELRQIEMMMQSTKRIIEIHRGGWSAIWKGVSTLTRKWRKTVAIYFLLRIPSTGRK